MLHINIKLSKKYVSLADIIILNIPVIWLESDCGVGADVGMYDYGEVGVQMQLGPIKTSWPGQ